MNKYQEAINEIIETSGEFLTEQEKKSIEILQELVDKATAETEELFGKEFPCCTRYEKKEV